MTARILGRKVDAGRPADERAEMFRWPDERPLLAAAWRRLVMLNFEVDPAALAPLVPRGTELDDFEGATYASIVGFMFLDSRLFGLPIPFHHSFEEVNLRFYVRRRADDGWRRAVVFVRELAPKRCVSWVARTFYGEHYVTVPMAHGMDEHETDADAPPRRVEYAWIHRCRPGRVVATCDADAWTTPAAGSLAEFIVEHYWAYTALPRGRTREYRVAHPRWHVAPAASASFSANVANLYVGAFAPFLSKPPASALLVDGSPVRVYSGRLLA